MHLPGNVDLPLELDEALRQGDLVVFAGAGISMDAPSGLPSFTELTRQILAMAGTAEEPDEARLDQQLGEVHGRGGFDVHVALRRILGVPAEPNRWHESIVSLWQSATSVRIVTTNYDELLEEGAERVHGVAPPAYSAPALPLGRDFHGVVHLHGSLSGPDDGLVAIDSAFSRAYLTEGWARRFLVDLFLQSTVLFVGYSHSDLVISYLARGLPSGTNRYALVPAGSDQRHWDRLGITPITYGPPNEGRHELGALAIREWAGLSAMGYRDHQRRIAELVALGPPLDPVRDSYLRTVFNDHALARFFCANAAGEAWLAWISSVDAFERLFNSAAEPDEVTAELAQWFAEKYAVNYADTAFNEVAKRQGLISPVLWGKLAHAVWQGRPITAEVRALWARVLADNVPPQGQHDYLDYLARDTSLPEESLSLLTLLEALLQPDVRFREGIRVGEGRTQARVEIKTRGSGHWLSEIADEVIAPHLSDLAREVHGLATESLIKAHRILRAYGQASGNRDPISFRRSAIERHPQDRRDDDYGVVIDLARDSAVLLAEEHGPIPVVGELMAHGVPILTRLAVWLVSVADGMTPDGKLDWLLGDRELFEVPFHHEMYSLIGNAFPDASAEAKHRIWEGALEAWPIGDERSERHLFDLAQWLSESDPEFEPVHLHLTDARERHPEWEPSEHPDFRYWIGGWVKRQRDAQPLAYEALHAREVESASNDWAYEMVEDVGARAARDPTWGIGLIEWLADHKAWQSALWSASLTGLGRSSLTTPAITSVVAACDDHPEPEQVLDGLTELLVASVNPDTEPPTHTDVLSRAALLLLDLIQRTAPDSVLERADRGDVVFDAVNSWSGRAAQFWVQLVWRIEQEEREACETPGFRDFLAAVDSRRSERWAQLAIVMACRTVPFLLRACPELAASLIAGWFDWGDPLTARAAWSGHGYGTMSRSTVDLLYSHLPGLAEHLSDLDDQARRPVLNQLGAIAVGYEADHRNWLAHLVHSNDTAIRVELAFAIESALEDAEPVARDRVWDSWLRSYWADRCDGLPRPFDPLEGATTIRLALHLPAQAEEVIGLVLRTPVDDGPSHGFIRDLRESALVAQDAIQGLRVLGHVLGAKQRVYDPRAVVDILSSASEAGAHNDLISEVCEQLARLGITETGGIC